ncbi:hypothetical protein HCU64_23985 [Methylobacterium sp. C25]|nr:hypothetical protein [Methylobacterium sp. C25]
MAFHPRSADAGLPLDSEGRYTLGMPHLCPSGFSENWLWKELGHRHWELIGQSLGRAASGFGTEREQPIYAAFQRISLEHGALDAVRENDILEVRSALILLSATRVVSRHRAACGGRLVADVEMTSVFIQRRIAGENRSITRVKVGRHPAGPALVDVGNGHRGSVEAGALPSWTEMDELGSVVVDPCPQLEFNGAGLLYFSSYVAAVDRTEWQLSGRRRPRSTTRARRVVFHSNIEIGDRLVVRIKGSMDGATARFKASICSEADGRLLAEVMTDCVNVPMRSSQRTG